jgi:hypothetical protein
MIWESLTYWCDVHGIVLKRDTNGVRATAYDRAERPITTLLHVTGPVARTKEAELAAAIKVCDDIAEELHLLKPSIAHKLNTA